VIGTAGSGYTFAIEDGDGNLVVATNPVDESQALITKMPIGESGTASGPNTGQV
jgi:hypothetical protein